MHRTSTLTKPWKSNDDKLVHRSWQGHDKLVHHQHLSPPSSNLSSNGTYGFATGTSGNVSAMITPGPSIQTLTTYYIAPWQELTAATAPSDVIRKVCQTFANGTEECVTEYQVWHTSLI